MKCQNISVNFWIFGRNLAFFDVEIDTSDLDSAPGIFPKVNFS